MTIFLIFSFVMGIACLFAMVSLIIKKKFVSFLGLLVILLLSIFNFSNTFYSLKGISENRKISVNLEIVHPFISDKEYLLLIFSNSSFELVCIYWDFNKNMKHSNAYIVPASRMMKALLVSYLLTGFMLLLIAGLLYRLQLDEGKV